MIDIDRFQEILDELFHQQPECCLDELNGGVCLLPDCNFVIVSLWEDISIFITVLLKKFMVI